MTELTDKMRTCAAFLATMPTAPVLTDAATLLIEAADLLDDAIKVPAEPEMLGEPMQLIMPLTVPAPPSPYDEGWVAPGGKLPGVMASGTRSPRACPRCGSRAYKRVFRKERKMYLHCGVCGHEWLFDKAVQAALR